jgi:hypothetical protein
VLNRRSKLFKDKDSTPQLHSHPNGKGTRHESDPLPAFIEHIYLKRFGRDRPADVKSFEEILKAKEKKKEERRRKKELQKEARPSDQKTNSFALEKA